MCSLTFSFQHGVPHVKLPEASKSRSVVFRWNHRFLFLCSCRSITNTENQQQHQEQQGRTHRETHQKAASRRTDEVQQTVMSKQVQVNAPLLASHFYLLVLPWSTDWRTRRDTQLYAAVISHVSEVVSTNSLNTRAAHRRLTRDFPPAWHMIHFIVWLVVQSGEP